MNKTLKLFTKNFSYSVFANIFTALISSLLVFVIPRYINTEAYGYWQLYNFYLTYIAYLSLGLTDGIYLRFGGYEYRNLDFRSLSTQHILLIIFNILCDIAICFTYLIVSNDTNKEIVIILSCIAGLLIVPRSIFTFALQATNRIKEYSLIIIVEKAVYLFTVVVCLILKQKNFVLLVSMDIVGKLVATIYSLYICKDIAFSPPRLSWSILKEVKTNIAVGSKLLFASLASTLIIGIVRMGIENSWSIETFGKVSLTLSVSNLLLVLINSVGMVLFPMLCRISADKLPRIYNFLRTVLMVPLLLMLVLYYPIKVVLSVWLPQYADSLTYMALLFPMCIFECKMAMLINTYLKSMRKEKWLLIVNLITVGLSVISTILTVYILHNLTLAIVSIVLLLAIRCVIAESLLAKELKVSVSKDIIAEIILTVVFMMASWCIGGVISVMIYLIAYVFYLFIKRKDIVAAVKTIKPLLKKAEHQI